MGGFDEFFADNYDDVVRSLALAIGDRQRAEDAAQEAFAKAYRRWPAVVQMDRPVGWVLVVGHQSGQALDREERSAVRASGGPNDVVDHAEGVRRIDAVREASSSCRHDNGQRSSCATCATSPPPMSPTRWAVRKEP